MNGSCIRRCFSRHVKTIFRICFGVRSSRSGIWSSCFSALEYLGPILNAVGKYAPFSVLVAFAEKTLNVSLPNAYKIREEVLNRKTKSTDFLERLIDALIEKSAK